MTEHADGDRGQSGLARTTSPMQIYGTREVGVGFVVLAVGLLVAFVLPYLLI